MDLTNFLAGRQILEEVESPINGKLTVVRDLAWGTTINGGGLPQSGGLAEKVWKKPLKKVRSRKSEVGSVLILGLGGGSIAKLIRKNWPARAGEPDVKITGVDIDPVIVELGKKYMKLDDYDVDVVIKDAYRFMKTKKLQTSKTPSNKKVSNNKNTTYDLICVDLYIGDKYPKKFEAEKFLTLVRTVLSEPEGSTSRGLARGGVAVFNRLYFDEKRTLAKRFEKKLEKVFSDVEVVYPLANIVFICSN